MLVALVFAMLVTGVIIVGTIGLLMWAAQKWASYWLALAIGIICVGYFCYSIVQLAVFCSADPVWVPNPDSPEGGTYRFNCDSAGGIVDRLYIYIVGPMIVVALIWLTARFGRQKASA